MDNRLNKFVKAILDFSFFVGLIMEAAVPFGLKYAVLLVMKLWGETTEYAEILNHYPYAVVSIMMLERQLFLFCLSLGK